MVQFLSIIFFSWISSIFVGFFKSSRICVSLYLTAIGQTPGGISTVHIYKQTVHRTTQSTKTIHRTTQFTNQEECGPCPVFARYTLAFALQLREKNGKKLQSGQPENASWHMKTEYTEQSIHNNKNTKLTELNKSTQNKQPYTQRQKRKTQKYITTLQHFATFHHTSPNYTSLHLSTLHSLTFTLHYPLIWLNPFTFPTAVFHLTSLNQTQSGSSISKVISKIMNRFTALKDLSLYKNQRFEYSFLFYYLSYFVNCLPFVHLMWDYVTGYFYH